MTSHEENQLDRIGVPQSMKLGLSWLSWSVEDDIPQQWKYALEATYADADGRNGAEDSVRLLLEAVQLVIARCLIQSMSIASSSEYAETLWRGIDISDVLPSELMLRFQAFQASYAKWLRSEPLEDSFTAAWKILYRLQPDFRQESDTLRISWENQVHEQ